MQAMTRKELSNLTMKQIIEYCVMKGAKKIPKKWQDKTTALDWVDKNLGAQVEKKKEPTKAAAVKTGKKSSGSKDRADRQAIARRHGMVKELLKGPCTANELQQLFGNEYKSVLDDLHAIRHNRNEEGYLEKDEVLIGIYVGRCKAFQVVKKSVEKKVTEQIKEELVIVE